MLTFFFGCFHGLGLARAMDFLAFRMVDLDKMAKSFYNGFALGIAGLSLVVFLILFFVRQRPFYVPIVLRGGSLAALIAAAGWLGWQLFWGP